MGLLPKQVDALAGLELGGVPLATVCSQVSGLPTLFVRKQAKSYGTCRLAEGGPVAGRRLVVIEDVVTEQRALEEQHCAPAVREPFITALQADRPGMLGVGIDFSNVMLAQARKRFDGDELLLEVARDGAAHRRQAVMMLVRPWSR